MQYQRCQLEHAKWSSSASSAKLAEDFDTISFDEMIRLYTNAAEPFNDNSTTAANLISEETWLAMKEKVECKQFEGKDLEKTKVQTESYFEVPEDLRRADRRKGKHTTVTIKGFAVSKSSIQSEQSVPPTKAKQRVEPRFDHQQHCLVCSTRGELMQCNYCPRSYHHACIADFPPTLGIGNQWICPGHKCFGCAKKVEKVGGMLCKCRLCTHTYCEDCLDFQAAQPIGDTLPELKNLNYGVHQHMFYILCPTCKSIPYFAPSTTTSATSTTPNSTKSLPTLTYSSSIPSTRAKEYPSISRLFSNVSGTPTPIRPHEQPEKRPRLLSPIDKQEQEHNASIKRYKVTHIGKKEVVYLDSRDDDEDMIELGKDERMREIAAKEMLLYGRGCKEQAYRRGGAFGE